MREILVVLVFSQAHLSEKLPESHVCLHSAAGARFAPSFDQMNEFGTTCNLGITC